jgi:sirohydrochlorin ferrochelatase
VSPLPPLVLAAHGSPHPDHALAVRTLRDAVAAASTLPVTIGWLSHGSPRLPYAAARAVRASADGTAVVVPLLLAAGHHALSDLPRLLAGAPGAVPVDVLGTDPLLAAALARRLAEAGARAGDAVVVAAAGSSNPAARDEVATTAHRLQVIRSAPVLVGYASGPGPRVQEAVSQLRLAGHRVAVASYLLGPGAFACRVADLAKAAGADVVSAPLGSAPEVVAVVRQRWAEGARRGVRRPAGGLEGSGRAVS